MRSISRNWMFIMSLFVIFINCKSDKKSKNANSEHIVNSPLTFTTPLGKKYIIKEPADKLLHEYEEAKKAHETNISDVDAMIWYGRRTAYLGRYDDAIAIYSNAIDHFPNDPRLYRHRGHRYISIRKFNEAIADLEKAGELIQNTENEVEPDGIPNSRNIPVSTLHGNIWYHLGLAHYLNHDYEKAYDTYLKCRAAGKLHDNIVSSTHWLYMIQRRLGDTTLANETLDPITKEMNVIENHSYYDLCKMYKGMIPIDSLLQTGTGNPSNDAVTYGVANWYFYNNEKEKAAEVMRDLVASPSWSSFGYIAAESDLMYYYGKENP